MPVLTVSGVPSGGDTPGLEEDLLGLSSRPAPKPLPTLWLVPHLDPKI